MATATSHPSRQAERDPGSPFSPAPSGSPARPSAEGADRLWGKASSWGLVLLLTFFAVAGVSPFSNAPIAMRTVAAESSGDVAAERAAKLIVIVLCVLFASRQWSAVRRLAVQMKLVTAFPLVALALCPVSQMPTRTISSAMLLLCATLLLYSIMVRYSFDQVLEVFLVLGTLTIGGSIVFALALPQYGLDLMGGHFTAWKGIFSAKNYLGHMGLFFLTVAVSYRARTSFLRFVRAVQILQCLVVIAFAQAATAYVLTAFYGMYFVIVTVLHRLRKKDYIALVLLSFFSLVGGAGALAAAPEALFSLLGKDATLTGRTGIWVATLAAAAKRPLFGYGYQAFWLGLEGESYHVVLAVSWMLAQAQNGFIDVTLEMGAVGLIMVLLIFGFAFRDALECLLRSKNDAQLRAVEWYLAIVLLTFLWNLDESFLFEPKHLGSMMFVLATIGLKREWMAVRAASEPAGPRAAPSARTTFRGGIQVVP